MTRPTSGLTGDARLRYELQQLLAGRNAHMTFEEATADFPLEHINTKPGSVPYTFWHLVEHLRIAQHDILVFVIDPAHDSPAWPEGYWPDPAAKATPQQWQASLDAFLADRTALAALAEDPAVDLLAELPHAPGYTVLREIALAADHNAYHIGELGILRQTMGLWP